MYEIVQIANLELIIDKVTVPGQTKFFFRHRFGGRVIDNDAVKTIRA